jgi:hypothetical protein
MNYLPCVLALFVCTSAYASPCSSTQYDMLNWFSLANDWSTLYHLTGNANPLYSYHDWHKQRIYSVFTENSGLQLGIKVSAFPSSSHSDSGEVCVFEA